MMKTFQVIHITSQAAYCRERFQQKKQEKRSAELTKTEMKTELCVCLRACVTLTPVTYLGLN